MISKEKLLELYLNQKLSSRRIGEKLGCSHSTVLKFMREHNIDRREKTERRQWTESEITIVKQLYGKIPAAKIAEMLPDRTKVAVNQKAEQLELTSRLFLGFKEGHVPWNKGKGNGGSVVKHCLVCGEEIRTSPCLRDRKKFCSRKCLGLYAMKMGYLDGKRPHDLGLPPWNKGKRGLQVGWNKGKKLSREHRDKLSETRTRKLREDPEFRKLVRETSQRNIRKLHNNLEVQKRRFKAMVKKPNKKEQRLIRIFKANNLPFKYVGDGQVVIGRKCPDFMNWNGGKQFIEFFGNYWHTVGQVEERKRIFAQYGFDTLIIWENELANEDKIVQKVKRFMGQSGKS